LEIFRLLLNKKPDVNKTDFKARTALHLGISISFSIICYFLFFFIAPNVEVIDVLVKYGADINAQDMKGYTPLMTLLCKT
jgi:ankyrin repeat protein